MSESLFPNRFCQCGEEIHVWRDYQRRVRLLVEHGGVCYTTGRFMLGETLAAVGYECPRRRWWNFWRHDKGRAWRPR
jgi:hypothetical protein